MTLFLDEMQDSDSERKEGPIKTGREEEKKEKDLIIFQEMITIPNQEESDELVGGRCHMLAKFYRIKSWIMAPLNDLVLNVWSVINHAGIAYTGLTIRRVGGGGGGGGSQSPSPGSATTTL